VPIVYKIVESAFRSFTKASDSGNKMSAIQNIIHIALITQYEKEKTALPKKYS
jgi:hypothetical protein